MKVVDTHVHVVSDDEARYPLQPSDVTGPWYRDDPCSVERLLGIMDAAGVDAAVLVQGITAYGHDNRYMLDSANRFPGRCTSVACVDLAGPDPVAAVDHEAGGGARGIRWVAIREGGVAEPRAVWDAVGRLGLPVVVTILADRLGELAATLPRLPPVPLALDHCAFADFSRGIPDALAALAAFPRLHLKVSTNALDLMAAHGEPAEVVEELAARFGGYRLMWGSDYSQTHDRPYAELAEWGRQATAKLSDDDREHFLGASAVAVWPELGR